MSNLVTNKFRKGTSTKMSFPTLPSLTVQPRRIDLIQKQYSHDVLVMEFPAESTLWFETLKTGVPVEFNWRQSTTVKNWIGYVSSVSKSNAPQRTNVMTVMCVGTTFVLKERATRVFQNHSIPEVVQIIGEEFGFNVIFDNHPQVFTQLNMTAVSYWEWMVEQAKRIGYGLVADGMDLYFKPLDKLIDLGFSNSAILSMGNAGAPFNTQFLDRTLDQFKVVYGDNVEDTNNFRATKNVGGVSPFSKQVLLSNSTPTETGTSLRTEISPTLFQEYRTDRVINSQTDAEQAAKGAAQMARFNIPAVAKAQGDPRIHPFGSVYIAGTGSMTDGFWVVREAHHMFHKVGDYQLELKVATDGVGDEIVQTPFRTRKDLNSVTATGSPVGTINLDEALLNGTGLFDFEMSSVTRVTKENATFESNQGFTKTPTVWRRAG